MVETKEEAPATAWSASSSMVDWCSIATVEEVKILLPTSVNAKKRTVAEILPIDQHTTAQQKTQKYERREPPSH